MQFFDLLNDQISENIIVEDELALARLAALLPGLLEAIRQTLEFTNVAEPALANALHKMQAILPPEDLMLAETTEISRAAG